MTRDYTDDEYRALVEEYRRNGLSDKSAEYQASIEAAGNAVSAHDLALFRFVGARPRAPQSLTTRALLSRIGRAVGGVWWTLCMLAYAWVAFAVVYLLAEWALTGL